MTELKWTRRHDKFTMYDNQTPETENHIIVCPEDLDVRTAISRYMQSSGYYVEYMHFNNNGKLDGFLDHRNNMYVENNEYDIRNKYVINCMIHIQSTILCGQTRVILQ